MFFGKAGGTGLDANRQKTLKKGNILLASPTPAKSRGVSPLFLVQGYLKNGDLKDSFQKRSRPDSSDSDSSGEK